MWMTQYIMEIKKQFRDVYGFVPSRIVAGEPCFDDIPDGEYPMTIKGKLDRVKIAGGRISCCNFDTPCPAPNDPAPAGTVREE
jgi:hypothetical protein